MAKKPTAKKPKPKPTSRAAKKPAKKASRTPRKRSQPKCSAKQSKTLSQELEKFVESIANGREFYLACEESGADPKAVVATLQVDEEYVRKVNHAKRLAYEKVQAALYDSAMKGRIAAIKEWNELRGDAYDRGFGNPVSEADVEGTQATEEAVGRPSEKVR